MTTKVKVVFDQNPHDWEIEVGGRQGDQVTVEATLSEAGQEHVVTIWEGKDLVVRERRKGA